MTSDSECCGCPCADEARAESTRLRADLADAERIMNRDRQQAARATQGRDEARAEVERLRNEMAVTREWLHAELSSVRGQRDELCDEVKKRHDELDQARAEVARLRACLDNLPRPISTLTGQPCDHAADMRCIECVDEGGFRPAPIRPSAEES